ncbi:hypothetical protein PFNF54_01075 [Plasmodium falciparum NF54]|uniref:Uncharacterized protein n=1 Tax=Plasmodium falciparum (isolate NF54) TaxID=5843 RepID=W7KA85_PLAFO|nr:hypothetical protein PFNF54_01075 [Plasmodium falciparum NF54]
MDQDLDLRIYYKNIPIHLFLNKLKIWTRMRHAGYDYALETNSHVYASIDVENVKNIFILGPNHHIYNKGFLFPRVEKYETPFGFLQINKQIISDIIKSDTHNLYSFIDPDDDEEEHSIEMQLPLIKYIIKE